MTIYALYNYRDECVCVGTMRECAKFLNCDRRNICSLVRKTEQGKVNGAKGYKAYRIFKEKEENDG